MSRRTRRHVARAAALTFAACAATAADTARAADYYWEGGADVFNVAKYTKVDNSTSPPTITINQLPSTGTIAPAPTDATYIGADGSVTSSSALTIGLLRIGHNSTAAQSSTAVQSTAAPGSGTFTNTSGTFQLTGAAPVTVSGVVTPGVQGLIVGYDNTGSLGITGGTVNSSFYGTIGFADAPGATGSGSVTINGGTLTIRARGLSIGEGLPGSLSLSAGSLNVNNTGNGDLVVGNTSTATFTQTGGTTTVQNSATVGRNATTGASLSVTGGTFTSPNLSVGDATSSGASATLAGTSTVTTTGSITVGTSASSATGAVLNIGDTAKVSVGPLGTTSTANVFLGRGTSTVSFNMTGGTLDISNRFLMGTGTAPIVTGTQSAGSIHTYNNFVLADTGGTSTYTLSGGSISSDQGITVGRQVGTGVMNQTGGTATFGNRLRIGDAETSTTTSYGTGTYNLSGGSVTANVPTGSTNSALAIALNGTGTFRVIGSAGTVTVNGNVTVNAPAPGVGTLAYRLKAGDNSLTTITATGTATFAAGSVLQLDFNSVTPTQGVYPVLTAADVVNNGLVPSIPAGWNFQVAPGATSGKVLRFIAGDLNANGAIDADDFALLDRGRAMNLAGGASGDLNADGAIDAADYLLIDSAYGLTAAPFSPDFLSAREFQFGPDYVSALLAAVPEPLSLSSILYPLSSLLVMRRRRSR